MSETISDATIEVRLLDGFQVRGADGRRIDDREWHTGKTKDLLRMLALRAGKPVGVDQILERLWPDVDERHARGSLRTATSVLRCALGTASVQRIPGGLVLTNAWVDSVEFMSLAKDLSKSVRAGQAGRVVATANAAEAIYRQDFHACDDDAFWAIEAREELRMARTAVQVDAGEAALGLRWIRDALDFGHRAFAVDGSSERACRVLMAAHAGLGEMGVALRVYEDLRARLADELGTDPSPQTKALHNCLLANGPAPETKEVALVGRDLQVAELTGGLSRTEPARLRVVCVRGREGSGRSAVIAATLSGLGMTSRLIAGPDGLTFPAPHVLEVALRGADGVFVTEPVDALDRLAAEDVAKVIVAVEDDSAACLVIPATEVGVRMLAQALDRVTAPPPLVIDVPDLTAMQLLALAEQTLSGVVSEQLVTALATSSGGLAGTASQVLRGWAATGRFVWTNRGLMPTADPERSLGRQGSELGRELEPEEVELLAILATYGEVVDVETIHALRRAPSGTRAESARWLSGLADVGLVETVGDEFRAHQDRVPGRVEGWLSPDARRDLHLRIAGLPDLSGAAESWHRLHGGAADRACASVLTAAREALTQTERDDTRGRVLGLRRSAHLTDLSPEHRGLVERATQEAFGLLAPPIDPVVARLVERAQPANPSTGPDPLTRRRGLFGSFEELAEDTDAVLTEDVLSADLDGDLAQRVHARLRLCEEVAIPLRDPDKARRLALEAYHLAVEPEDQARALYLSVLCDVLMARSSQAQDALSTLEEAASLACVAEAHQLLSGIRAAGVLVRHRFGLPRLSTAMAELVDAGAPDLGTHPLVAATLIRVHTERFELTRARRVSDASPVQPTHSALHLQHRLIGEAILLEAEGRDDEALRVLEDCVRRGVMSQCSVQLPEAVARLITLEARRDPAAAASRCDLYKRTVSRTGATALEQTQMLLARAAVRAEVATPQRGVLVAQAAAQLAEDNQLVLAAGHGHLACVGYHEMSADSPRMRLSLIAAARCFEAAGLEAVADRLTALLGAIGSPDNGYVGIAG